MNVTAFNVLYCLVLLATPRPAEAAERCLPKDSTELYSLTNVWTVHLKVQAGEWDRMEPEGGPGMRPGPGGPRGPGMGDRMMAPPEDEGFGPGMFVAPALLARGDEDKDNKLSKAEFTKLGDKLFKIWDKQQTGKVNSEQLVKGLNASFEQPQPQPGRMGRGGTGFNLQGPEGTRNGLASALGIEFKYVKADLEFEGQAFNDVGVRYKGNGTFLESRGSLKRSLKIELNRNVKGQKLAGVKTLNLHNNVTDASWMNEVLSYRLYRDAKVPAPRTAYARVFVTVPGKFDRKYLGLYSLVENVDSDFTKEHFGTAKGNLFKPVTPELFTDLGDEWKNYQQTYDPKSDPSREQAERIMKLCKLVSNSDDATFAASIGDYVDLEAFARFIGVMVYLSDMDGIFGPGQNLYVFLPPKDGKLRFVPWDQDHSFGQFPIRGTQEQRENLSIQKPWDGSKIFLERVFKVPAFQKAYLASLREFSQGLFRPERLSGQVDEIARAIQPAIEEESPEKLSRFTQVVAGKTVEAAPFGGPPRPPETAGDNAGSSGPRRGGPFGGPGPMFQPPKPIKPFVVIRARSIQDQLDGKSKGMEVGGFGPGRGPRRGGPGPGDDFGPGMFLAGGFMGALDLDKNGELTAGETSQGFQKWFEAWNSDKTGFMTEKQLRAGLNLALMPKPGGFPGGPGPGFPGGPPPSSQ
jgi:spore coat protein H